ncbi:MAG: hypothetical protein R6U93_00440 [Dehalococcoidia bacterium]
MFLLEYLFFLGVAWIVFWLVNWLFGLLAVAVLTLTKFEKGFYITTALSGYIFVSLTALLTLGSIQLNPGTASAIVLPILGGFIVFTALGQSAYDRKKHAMESFWQGYDYQSMERVKYDGLLVIGLTALFVVMLFVPFIKTSAGYPPACWGEESGPVRNPVGRLPYP